MVGGKKHGQGMYIYADLTAYKGVWDEDRLNGVMHPMGEEQLPVEVALELQFSITIWNIQMVYFFDKINIFRTFPVDFNRFFRILEIKVTLAAKSFEIMLMTIMRN